MPRSKRRIAYITGSILAVILLVVVARIGWGWKRALDNVDAMIVPTVSLPTATPAPTEANKPNTAPVPTVGPTAVPAPDDPVNIVLLGTDARPGDEVSRTDAVIVVHVDPRANRVAMLSLPRDLWVKIPGYGQARVNAAYPIGEKQFGAGYGPALVKQTVGDLLGMQINHFVLINFDGFKTLIDRVGGVTINVEKEINDPAYPTEDYKTIKLHFDPGIQTMDGDRALMYARTRHADNDFGRNQRQQQVLMALFSKISQQGLLTQIDSLDDYTGALRDYVRTDITQTEMLSLATAGAHLTSSSIERYAIEPNMLVTLQAPATFAADAKALKKLVSQIQGETVVAAGENQTDK